MKKEELDTLENIVTRLLVEKPVTRKNDRVLIGWVYKKLGVDIKAPFQNVLLMNHIPSFESITRARRKAQEKNPELVDKVMKDIRKNEELEFIKYNKGE